jgi:hypothetical protein
MITLGLVRPCARSIIPAQIRIKIRPPLPSPLGCRMISPMCRNSKPRSNSTKLSPRSAVDADMEMGRRIRLLRREKGISQIDLAGHLGLSFQQL